MVREAGAQQQRAGNADAQAQDGRPTAKDKAKKALETMKNTGISKVYTVHKIIQCIMAAFLIILSVVRILFMDHNSITSFMVSVYWALFGLMFICVEFDIKKSRLWFYFLNSSLGKGLTHIFMFLLCFGSGDAHNWVDVLLAILFSFTATAFLIMHCFFKELEPTYIESLITKVRMPADGPALPPPNSAKDPSTNVDTSKEKTPKPNSNRA